MSCFIVISLILAQELHNLVFSYDIGSEPFLDSTDLANVLCLPVPVSHLLPDSNNSNVRYFVVDCRPADQYNNGHLSTAFHLDCSLVSYLYTRPLICIHIVLMYYL